MRRLQEQHGLVLPQDGPSDPKEIVNGVPVRVDLEGLRSDGIIGFKARAHAGLIDIDKIGHYDVLDYWEPVVAPKRGGLILDPAEFYILASQEAVRVPPGFAAEMIAYDTLVGEFRVHYAGFFDPGFGHVDAGGEGSRAVLEVRSYEVPFVIEHGQLVGRLTYERLTAVPAMLYGQGGRSNYQGQGIKLSKHFKPLPPSFAGLAQT
jgi:dCTP deaminase